MCTTLDQALEDLFAGPSGTIHLHRKWATFLELYGSQQHVDLLNNTAPAFFRMLQEILWMDIVLHLTRLTDPPNSGGSQANLTIRILPGLCNVAETRNKVEELVADAVAATAFARKRRNKQLAHTDMRQPSDAFTPVTRHLMERAIGAIDVALNAASYGMRQVELDARVPMREPGTVSLLEVLDRGQRNRDPRSR